MGGEGEVDSRDEKLACMEIKLGVSKEDIQVHPCVIQSIERKETDEEMNERKAREEDKAEEAKRQKRKPPAKGEVKEVNEGSRLIKMPVENSMDLGFSMPLYTKWATSQL